MGRREKKKPATEKTQGLSAVAVYVISVCGDGRLSKLICKITGGRYSHSAIGFRLSDGTEVYYEALVGKGFRGPKPLTHLVEWQAENRARRLLVHELLDVTAVEAENARLVTETFSSCVTYSEWQLFLFWMLVRLGADLFADTPNRVICSEIVARILITIGINLRIEDTQLFDEIPPQQIADLVAKRYRVMVRYAAGLGA